MAFGHVILHEFHLDRYCGDSVTNDYANNMPGTPAWAEKIAEVGADKIIHAAREFASNLKKPNGKSMVILVTWSCNSYR